MQKLIFLLTIISMSACYYDNKDDLYEYVTLPSDTIVVHSGDTITVVVGSDPCTTQSVSYSVTLKPILDLECNDACHNAIDRQGNIILETYNTLLPYVNNGKLMGSIKHETGYVAMPESSKLSNCEISKFQSWVDAGAPNN